MKRVFITTTEAIENAKILEYKGTVMSTIVAGTGFLSDFAASVTDFFGGRSGTYKKHMNDIYYEALDEISTQASRLSANAIIGCDTEFSSIPGKGMSMLMIAVTGTAVKVEFNGEQKQETIFQGVQVLALENEINKRKILDHLSKGFPPTEKQWKIIQSDPHDEYAIPLIKVYLGRLQVDPSSGYIETNDLFSHISESISLFSQPTAIEAAYTLIQANQSKGISLIQKNHLFNAKAISELIDKGMIDTACELLYVTQPFYNANDLSDMKALSEKIHHLPERGKIKMVKGGVFSKDAEKYICPDGHVNNKDVEYCKECGKNICGLTKDNVEALEKFDRTVEALEYLLNG